MTSPDIKVILKFTAILVIVLIITYISHDGWISDDVKRISQISLVNTYWFNALFTLGVFSILMYTRKKYRESFGFFFLGSSALKFILFFILFYPDIGRESSTRMTEFMIFFIPYAVCLILEVYFLVNVLMKD